MSSAFFQTVTGAVVTFGVGVALVVSSFGSVTNAEARIRGPRNTEQAQICGWIQDQYDLWWARYAAAPLDSDAEAEALEQMHNLEDGWKSEGCDDDYGSIVARPAPVKALPVMQGAPLNTAR
jgi:hypothetical protein